MKAKLLVLLFLLSTVSVLYAQDVIVKQNGDEIKAKVTEVGITDIKYKKFENESGPVYVIAKADVFMIKYENGTAEVIKKTQPATNSTVQNTGENTTTRQSRVQRETGNSSVSRNSRQNVNTTHNMDANQGINTTQSAIKYRHLYPGLSFGLSFLYPGIGQFYNGQAGKGAIMAVLATGSLVTMIGVSGSVDTGSDMSDGQSVAVGAAALVYAATWIWGMIDAPVSAGAINRRNQALSWNVGKDSKLSITPDVLTSNLTGIKTGYQSPAYGLSLKLDF